ncbi:MAG: rod-binding protein [Deltaproteobacteria bacterium]|nr:rod-binding protein [Deltaproteobacteria bacterium]
MVGSTLCSAYPRLTGTEAGRVREVGRKIHGGIFLLFLLLAQLITVLAGAGVKPRDATPQERAAAQGMEALMVDQMIQEMRKTVPDNDIVPVSHGERVYRSMLDSEYARILSESGTLGIAELIVAEMRGRK